MDEKVINLEDLESMPEFKCGLWYSPYVKIYTIGGRNRIAEISNYPRAYKDTTRHVYTEDIPFTANDGDLNDDLIDGETEIIAGDIPEGYLEAIKADGFIDYQILNQKDDWLYDGEDEYRVVDETTVQKIRSIERVHRDSKDNIFRVGEEATHYIGDSLPGAFPRWIESEDIPFATDPEEASREATIHKKLGLPVGEVTLTDNLFDKQIIRIKYQRVL